MAHRPGRPSPAWVGGPRWRGNHGARCERLHGSPQSRPGSANPRRAAGARAADPGPQQQGHRRRPGAQPSHGGEPCLPPLGQNPLPQQEPTAALGFGIRHSDKLHVRPRGPRRLSSVVEQRFCKAKAIGSNPLAGFQLDPAKGQLVLAQQQRSKTFSLGDASCAAPWAGGCPPWGWRLPSAAAAKSVLR